MDRISLRFGTRAEYLKFIEAHEIGNDVIVMVAGVQMTATVAGVEGSFGKINVHLRIKKEA